MSVTWTATPVAVASEQTERPSFFGLLRGELFKIARQRAMWVMAAVLALLICAPYLIEMAAKGGNEKTLLTQQPLQFLYIMGGSNLLVLRVFSGTFLILLTARLIGMEYSSGTIRVLLARGVGRLQLLGAKLLAMAVVALAVLAGALVIDALLSLATLSAIGGNLDALKAINGDFWNDMLVYIGTVLISMGVSILMAAAVTVLTRSLAAGMSIAVTFFAADNIGVIFFLLASRLTGSNFWTLATGDLLGPNLNVMAGQVLPARAAGATFASGAFAPPLVPVTGGHTLLVTAIWGALFIVAMVWLTWKRDVQE
ncbi:MAG: hypothetical protein OJF49_004183 [Ktedonobacterales bacterium]|jgi:ABC-type transport system involved in multi-copper enzyme maturation permease subunit|nr:MAG: hypothetical protein OJF49_004183 [Ktedonobacterales bacterium]